MATSKYKLFVSDTPNGQREVRFHRLDQQSPMLQALYAPTDKLSGYENGAERDIDPEEHAKVFTDLRDGLESTTATAQAKSLQEQGLGIAPEGSDGIAVEGTTTSTPTQPPTSKAKTSSPPPAAEPKLPGSTPPPQQS